MLGIPIGIGLLCYFVPKKLGYPRVAKYLTISFGLIVLFIGLYYIFEDQLFTKNNAKELLEEQEFVLIDDFVLLKNESTYAIGDYYHAFVLKISDRDKEDAISKIKSSTDFRVINALTDTLQYQRPHNRYYGNKSIKNYETEISYVREYFEPSGREGFAPTFRRISISKTQNELTFEDIDE